MMPVDPRTEREWAEGQLVNAKQIEAAARKAAKDHAKAETGGRAVGLRTDWVPTLTDGPAAARHYWQTQRPDMEAFLLTLAEREVRLGRHAIPGFTVTAVKSVV